MTLLNNATVSVDVVFSAVEIEGPVDGFGLSKWVRETDRACRWSCQAQSSRRLTLRAIYVRKAHT